MPFSLIEFYRLLRRTQYVRLRGPRVNYDRRKHLLAYSLSLNIEIVYSSETSVNF
jgi:hypothetical protein